MSNESVTLRQYYLSFKSISGVMAGVFGAIPLLSKFVPAPYTCDAFPPMGTAEVPARFAAVVLALALTFCAFFARGDSTIGARKRIIAATVVDLVCLYWPFSPLCSHDRDTHEKYVCASQCRVRRTDGELLQAEG
jgi:hypothetical protein